MLSKRNFLLASVATLSQVKFGFIVNPAFAQVVPGPISNLTPTQRMLLDGVLYSNVPAYIAFAQTVGVNLRGSDALQKFDSTLSQIQRMSADQLQASLDQVISKGVAIDCVLQQATSSIPTTLPQLLSSTLPDIGLAETIARQVGPALQQGSTVIADVSALLSSQQIQIIPTIPINIFPAGAVDQYLDYGLNLIASAGGLSSVLATTMTFISDTQAVSQEVQTALENATAALNVITSGISNLATSSPDSVSTYSAAATEIATAVTALGKATGMNSATTAKIATAVKVLGSVVSGAVAGAAFGPIGAAAGAVVGLLGGLFGGGGGGGNATVQALSQVSSQISQLSQQMAAGFTQLGQQLATLSGQVTALSQQIDQDFAALEQQIQNVAKQVSNLGANILALNDTVIGIPIVALGTSAQLYETEYRKSRINVQNQSDSLSVTLKSNFQSVLALTTAPSTGLPDFGFGAPMYVGMGYGDYLKDFSSRLLKMSLADSLNLAGIYTGLPNASGSPFLSMEVSNLAKNLRSRRYGATLPDSAAPSVTTAKVGAAVVAEFQQQCFSYLNSNWANSPEFAMISDTVLRPATNFKCPNPVAPEDLWLVLSTIQTACNEISDSATSTNLLQNTISQFSKYLQAHYLLTGQNSLPALLYIRRQVLIALADAATVVFCNPFAAALDTYRRAVATKASANATYQQNHTTMKILSVAQVTQMLTSYQRSSMPLANVSTFQFNSNLPITKAAVALVGQEAAKIIQNQQVNPFPSVVAQPYLTASVQYDMAIFAPQLAKVISEISGKPLSSTPFSNYLRTIRDACLLLGIIESCVSSRIQALQLASNSGAAGQAAIPVPVFGTWFNGFKEYGTIAAYALAQPLDETSASSSRPVETSRAEIVIRSFLDGTLPVPHPPESLPGFSQPPESARPYPVEIGSFWGWGAEQCRPLSLTPPALVQAILRPECALAAENSSVLGAVSCFLQLQANLGVLNSKADLLNLMNQQYPGPNGIAQALRAKLSSS